MLKEEKHEGVDPYALNCHNLLRVQPFTLHLPARKQFTTKSTSQSFLGGLVSLNDYQTIFEEDYSAVKRIYESTGLKVAQNQFTTREVVDK